MILRAQPGQILISHVIYIYDDHPKHFHFIKKNEEKKRASRTILDIHLRFFLLKILFIDFQHD